MNTYDTLWHLSHSDTAGAPPDSSEGPALGGGVSPNGILLRALSHLRQGNPHYARIILGLEIEACAEIGIDPPLAVMSAANWIDLGVVQNAVKVIEEAL